MGHVFSSRCPLKDCPSCRSEWAGEPYPIDPIINRSGGFYTSKALPVQKPVMMPGPVEYQSVYGYY